MKRSLSPVKPDFSARNRDNINNNTPHSKDKENRDDGMSYSERRSVCDWEQEKHLQAELTKKDQRIQELAQQCSEFARVEQQLRRQLEDKDADLRNKDADSAGLGARRTVESWI